MNTMTHVNTFEEAADWIESVGFAPLSRNPFGLPSLDDVTLASHWHTGEETDPWLWKDRLALTKKAAYARLMQKRLTFVSPGWYPVFLSAYKSPMTVDERYEDGLLSAFARQLYRCLDGELPQGTHELRARLSVDKETSSVFDAALSELQCAMDITVSGSTHKRNKQGEPYGWSISAYTTVAQWAPRDAFEQAVRIPRGEAIERIAEQIGKLAPHLGVRDVKKFLGVRELR